MQEKFKKEIKILILLIGAFLFFYFMPLSSSLFKEAVFSALKFLNEYSRQHVLTCLIPAFFIAGAISVFVKKDYILCYLGAKAKKYISYSLASVSGAILAVCSCTILPLFAGIRKRGAGLGPATTFLYAGPAINIAAMFLTMSVLGIKIGIARILGAIVISVIIGLTMQAIFREEVKEGKFFTEESKDIKASKRVLVIFFAAMIGVLIVNGLQISNIIKFGLMALLVLITAFVAIFKMHKETTKEWLLETWVFVKTLLPVLFAGVFVAGFIMPLLPQSLVVKIVGSNSVFGNLIASIFGAFMYFSTLTEIPILQAFIAKGMHQGPALALLLSGPSLSLPSMLVIRKVIGTKKMLIYLFLVIFFSTLFGYLIGPIL